MVTNSSAEPAGSVSIFSDGDLYLNLRQYESAYSDFINIVLVPVMFSTGSGLRPKGSFTIILNNYHLS